MNHDSSDPRHCVHLLVVWLIYTIVMWVWALILDIGAWVEANIVFFLLSGC